MILWVALEECFDHQKLIYFLKERHDWQNICFKDFKSVNECNPKVVRIWSLLKFCKEDLTETDLLEKAFSTFHASNMLLWQQYRERKFTEFSDYYPKKNNNLLMKNNQSLPTGSQALLYLKANTSASRGPNHRNRNKGCDKDGKPKPEIKGR